ncbi:hypothetical protein [Microbulbifer yueqingensis]|uniref:Uncharacterized protein n=1 Tax=Microbulbifer yueqingensis TaxID=658219 RepID=A0A1G9C025_9GAMM|nr:hypothetical protein [Microbulbifer yueqingensis]SDK45052.1 hypothetical protein SAMN05216212_2427 [Microbulbifer yueqingensis]
MKLLRHLTFNRVFFSFFPLYLLVPLLCLAVSHGASAEVSQRAWAGNWLVVGEGDQQLVWQLHADGSGYAYGFAPGGELSHGFAISWSLLGDRVRVRTGAAVRCSGGVVDVAFTGWSPVTLDFAVLDGRHWRQHGGGLLSFQRRLKHWETPTAGSECPKLSS